MGPVGEEGSGGASEGKGARRKKRGEKQKRPKNLKSECLCDGVRASKGMGRGVGGEHGSGPPRERSFPVEVTSFPPHIHLSHFLSEAGSPSAAEGGSGTSRLAFCG